jgi:hypothetical protein
MVVDAAGYGTCRLIDVAEAFYTGCDPTDAAVTAQGLCPQDMIIFYELPPLVPAAAPTRHVASSQERAYCDWDIRIAREQFDPTIKEFDGSRYSRLPVEAAYSVRCT